MARAGTANAKPQAPAQPPGALHQLREVISVLMMCGVAALLLYGAFLGIRMNFGRAMPAWAVGYFFGCALVAAALFTIGSRIEPLPARRQRRGKRSLNVETPTQRQIWETAPGDFVEAFLSAIGMMGTGAMLVIDFFLVVGDAGDLVGMFIALGVGVGGFALEGAFVKWRGRSMFDPPGKVRPPKEEKEARQEARADHSDFDAGSFTSASDGGSDDSGTGSDGD